MHHIGGANILEILSRNSHLSLLVKADSTIWHEPEMSNEGFKPQLTSYIWSALTHVHPVSRSKYIYFSLSNVDLYTNLSNQDTD